MSNNQEGFYNQKALPLGEGGVGLRIDALRERGKTCKTSREFLALLGSDAGLKAEIADVYYAVYGKRLTGCASCLADAFFELTKQLNINKMEDIKKSGYHLRAGALLHDTRNFDAAKQLSNKNITEELALYHLATNPACRIYFDELPTDWESKVEAYLAAEAEAAAKADMGMSTSRPPAPSRGGGEPKTKRSKTNK